MLFNSLTFIGFFAAILALFFISGSRIRYSIILAGSVLFYAYAGPMIALLLIVTVFINYFATLFMESSSPILSRKALLIVAVGINLLFLAFFKYYNFARHIAETILPDIRILPALDILLPVGISFYTFQLTAYTVDVYRRRIDRVGSFGELLLFTTYFPQLVAGPIERAEVLMPRLRNIRPGTREEISRGVFLTIQGMLKKIVVADHLSEYVDLALLAGVTPPEFGYTFVGVIFALQIYADFSGYTDIARGISLFFGVPLSENFRLPFFSSNPVEIWRRWHITLMAFLRDYLYIPLGGSATGPVRQLINVLIVFSLGGLWHGAGIGYILWGVYSGIWVVAYHLARPMIKRMERLGIPRILLTGLGVIITFLSFSWGTLIIRSTSIAEIVRIFSHLLPSSSDSVVPLASLQITLYIWPLILMDLSRYIIRREELYDCFGPKIRSAILALSLSIILLLGSFGGEQFFYFQF